jgi:hypothetical protein
MSLYDDMERCDHCMARLRPGGCTRWGTEAAPCEADYDYDEDEEEDEEGGSEDPS